MPFKSKERKAEYYREWSKTSPTSSTERMGKWCQENPEKRMFRGAKTRAKKHGIEFSIEVGDIVIPILCPYLKVPLLPYAPRNFNNLYVCSLDRIDSTKGYIKGNIEVISHLANMMKSKATAEELKTFASSILERNSS